MKSLLIKLFFCGYFGSLLILASCSKEYYDDGGVHKPNYQGTIMSFLKSRPELFDTLVKVLETTKYAALLDNPSANITFFAPSSQTINRSVFFLNNQLFQTGQDTILDVRQVDAAVWEKFLGRYLFKDRSLLKDYPQIDTANLLVYPGQGYISLEGMPLNIGTFYNDVITKNSEDVTQVIKYAGYRQLFLNYENPVATSDIQPTNGVIHVLNFTKHSFGFKAENFALEAINTGIK